MPSALIIRKSAVKNKIRKRGTKTSNHEVVRVYRAERDNQLRFKHLWYLSTEGRSHEDNPKSVSDEDFPTLLK
jgi:hypothetical protein